MPDIELPSGRYISLSGIVRAGAGGQTRALLMRNRLFAQHAGVEPLLVTFDTAPVYPEVRASWREHGALVDPMQLLNLFEYYRETLPVLGEPVDDELPEIHGLAPREAAHPDGTLYKTSWVGERSGELFIEDFHRPDGTVYLRRPAGGMAEKNPASPYILTNEKGRVVGRWARKSGLNRAWLRQLGGDAERVMIISDSRFALGDIIPMKDPRFHVVHLMHNTHVAGHRRWNAPLSPLYEPLLTKIDQIDGLVTLTDRQRQDVAERYGRTSNLFVVPNPVDLPVLPDPLPARDPKLFTIVSRLEPQKRLAHAIQAFALVLEQEPEARLEIYGDGAQWRMLEKLVEKLDVGHAVTMLGHNPHARESLWTATAFLMSSGYEGYPLATLESLSHGCPVISYDIKYGPREQISHGVDGFLVEPGDMQGLADRIVELIRDPALAARMSEKAFEKAKAHDYNAFLRDWKHVLDTVVAQKQDRTRIDGVELDVIELGQVPLPAVRTRIDQRIGRRLLGARPASGSSRTAPHVRFLARLDLRGPGKPRTVERVQVTLDAVCEATADVVPVPLEVTRNGRTFVLSSLFDAAAIFESVAGDADSVRLRLRLVWENSSWETHLSRGDVKRPPYEIAFTSTGELQLHRGGGQA